MAAFALACAIKHAARQCLPPHRGQGAETEPKQQARTRYSRDKRDNPESTKERTAERYATGDGRNTNGKRVQQKAEGVME